MSPPSTRAWLSTAMPRSKDRGHGDLTPYVDSAATLASMLRSPWRGWSCARGRRRRGGHLDRDQRRIVRRRRLRCAVGRSSSCATSFTTSWRAPFPGQEHTSASHIKAEFSASRSATRRSPRTLRQRRSGLRYERRRWRAVSWTWWGAIKQNLLESRPTPRSPASVYRPSGGAGGRQFRRSTSSSTAAFSKAAT